MFIPSTMKTEITDAVQAFYRDYEATLKRQDAARRESLKPGQHYQPSKKLEGRYKDEFDEIAARHRDAVDVALDGLRREIMHDMTEAPSPEAAAAIAMLSARDKIGAAELSMYYERYGDNTPTRRALDSIAAREGLWNLVEPDTRAEAFNSLVHIWEKMTPFSVESSALSPAALASVAVEQIAEDLATLESCK